DGGTRYFHVNSRHGSSPLSRFSLKRDGGTRRGLRRVARSETNLLVRKKTAGRVSVCRGPAGEAAERAYFGPDYQSPSRASLRPRRSRARLSVIPPQTAPHKRHGRRAAPQGAAGVT